MAVIALLGMELFWVCAAVTRERLPLVHQPKEVRKDLKVLLAGSWSGLMDDGADGLVRVQRTLDYRGIGAVFLQTGAGNRVAGFDLFCAGGPDNLFD